MTLFRRTFLLEEIENIVGERSRTDSNENDKGSTANDIDLVYDRDELRRLINAKLRLQRSLIKRHAFYIDDVLYKSAVTVEEYSNLEDLEERVIEVMAMMNRHRLW